MSYPVLLFAAVAWVARGYVPPASLAETLGSLLGQAFTLIEGAYQRAPILVLALSALLILPVVAVISLATQAGRRRISRHSALRTAQRRAQSGPVIDEMPAAVPPRLHQAWLTVEGRSGGTMALAGDVIRIGRHEDNDIRLTDRSVHRHHAVIERTSDDAFMITDLSGKEGNGVRVNGARTARAKLADGDVIELGRAKLRFENAPV